MDEVMETNDINSTKKRRYRRLIFLIGITMVVCIVSTYAWFVGISKVSVNDIELSVKVGEGLQVSTTALSNSFTNSLELDFNALEGNLLDGYTSNTNRVVGEGGMVPISTSGVLDLETSKLKIFEKSAMTSTAGGYRIRVNKIDNSSLEGDGYLTFDLFFKNVSGNNYYSNYNQADDEGIYLNASSSVSTSSSGNVNGGMENAIRIAFMQIGRVNYEEGYGLVAQNITCSDTDSVTSLCHKGASEEHINGLGITYNIWEPNDVSHTDSSLEHFKMICKKRDSINSYSNEVCDSYNSLNGYVNTYAMNSEILSSELVDIYDGLNGFSTDKFSLMKYYTDTEKNYDEDNKTEFFFLAPNSITKIRVYVYLEGQDVDNYDLKSLGQNIKINFSFSKNKASDL